ncbi:MAG: twin-arginine translocase subunit TatC [Bacteroidales bacterium]|jgi:sec-independent protein translocase protein TatC|nr:twin-arginine translocase subunit TatC [Bacteroidales bacterium]MCI2146189.1 twin-arginine translocase subunit TatC [Bacteroidales bacterium]
MTFWEHLDELRKVIVNSLIAVTIVMVAVFFAKDILFKIVLAPTDSNFALYKGFNAVLGLFHLSPIEPFHIQLININVTAQFFIHMRIAMDFALVLTAPFVFYELWTFIRPALYSKEIKAVKKSFGFAAILFYIGILVGYFLIFPLTLRFLGTYQVSWSVPNTLSLNSYISMFVSMIFIMGIIFEMPCLAALLSRFGIINKQMMKKYRKHAAVILMVIAAIITPSGDAVTLLFVFVPLYLLYELSIVVCRSKKEDEDEDENEGKEILAVHRK